MKCDVDLNLLCIKYTEQTSAFLMLGTAASQNCFQGRLTVCISLVNGLLGVPNGSKMPSLLLISVLDSKTITEDSGAREPPKAQEFFGQPSNTYHSQYQYIGISHLAS